MKRFNCFFLVFALLFFAACSDGAERIVPETEKEGKSDEKNNEDDEVSRIDDDASDSFLIDALGTVSWIVRSSPSTDIVGLRSILT